jgi:predicted XRE-type DNA-binding protein
MAYNKGVFNPHAKLTDEDIKHIRALNAERIALRDRLDAVSQKAIAEKFGISQSRVSEICNGTGWGHIVEDES